MTSGALAEPPPTTPTPAATLVKGTVGAYDPVTRILSVTGGTRRKPTTTAVTLAANLRIFATEKRRLADLKQGDFVGASALKSADGKLRAQRINVLPQEMRGAGEGQYPTADNAPNRVMTNAIVAEVLSTAPNSGTLKVSYHGAQADASGICSGRANTAGAPGCTGDAEIVVAPGIPVTALSIGDESLLVPGAAVSVTTVQGPDGALQATRLTVDKDVRMSPSAAGSSPPSPVR
jgi:hypothetical protein